MKNFILLLAFWINIIGIVYSQTITTIMDGVVFYDGYIGLLNEPVPTDVFHLRNDLATKKITQSDLDAIGNDLTVNVLISASCDNYDRIGNVNIALIPKGSVIYHTDSVQKIEIGRFITPFMNKNKNPTSVSYSFSVDNLAVILKNQRLLNDYDFWLELQVFGAPYAANKEVAGCSGRNDIFSGKVDFLSTKPTSTPNCTAILYPISFQHYLNNYQVNATDELGTTKKSIEFTLRERVYDAKIHLITSNHGANEGGEEYVRRLHRIYFDESSVALYRPGGKSCEAYRIYNTQGNGIYGQNPVSESSWTSWNNWCPGDVIPTRIIELGTLEAGKHTFSIDVPSAQFINNQGYIPVSVYLQGSNEEILGTEIGKEYHLNLYPNPSKSNFKVVSNTPIKEILLYNSDGQLIQRTKETIVDVHTLESGLYHVEIQLSNGITHTIPFLKNE